MRFGGRKEEYSRVNEKRQDARSGSWCVAFEENRTKKNLITKISDYLRFVMIAQLFKKVNLNTETCRRRKSIYMYKNNVREKKY